MIELEHPLCAYPRRRYQSRSGAYGQCQPGNNSRSTRLGSGRVHPRGYLQSRSRQAHRRAPSTPDRSHLGCWRHVVIRWPILPFRQAGELCRRRECSLRRRSRLHVLHACVGSTWPLSRDGYFGDCPRGAVCARRSFAPRLIASDRRTLHRHWGRDGPCLRALRYARLPFLPAPSRLSRPPFRQLRNALCLRGS
jgi:hypothetical protein